MTVPVDAAGPDGQAACPGRPLVVFAAGAVWDDRASADRMLVTGLARYADILWVDPQRSVVSRFRGRRSVGDHMSDSAGRQSRLTRIDCHTIRLRPTALPLHTRAGVRHTTTTLVRAQIRWALRRLGRTPTAVVDSRLGRLLGGWGAGVTQVLYGTDDYVAGARLMGRSVSTVESDEAHGLRHADVVVAVSPTLARRWAERHGRVEVIPNGVDVDAYRAIDDVQAVAGVELTGPVAGVIGHLNARIDIDVLRAVIDAGASLLLVGPHDPRWEPTRFPALAAHPRVRWVGPQPFAELAAYLKHVDVGLTPYVDSDFNRASFPLKTLEYLAAGLPVVSTDLPASRWLDSDLVTIAADPADFAARVLAAARTTDDARLVAARRAFADTHSWASRADRAAHVIGLPITGSPDERNPRP